jgi:hypothetical protein
VKEQNVKANLGDVKRVLVKQIAESEGRPVPEPDDCPFCGAKPPFSFKDALSVKEHQITGLCQKCQDDPKNYGDGEE